MISRIVISILLLPVLFFSIYIGLVNFIFLYALIFIISVIANYELSRLFRKAYGKYLKIYEFSIYIFNFLFFYSYFLYRIYKLNKIIPLLIPILVIIFSISFLIFKRTGLRQLLLFIAGFIYTGVIPLLILKIRYFPHGSLLIYVLFSMVWVNDASALFIGSKYGKIKGLIKYSPNKTLEGYIGSFLITVLISVIFRFIFIEKLCLSFLEIVIISVVISITGHLGDILESALKRKANVKDSSRIFLGLGGILDIFDSVLSSVPFYYILIKLFCT